ncbi:uncharacterized protein UMAG_05977 [Mycosarcoma maydis]|uniref:Uncharacterized protein n=1 Tax=Mycosarcoma maydis TaxID=5270 RepID=A0A0D1DP58_MYCMD|nr:uncharacterized protein UMAG_05977 [Ustilago maydis 521]KIS66244.1 hypothetical protein UMAG_05977 [Ustilago maydis 521]|eukprot:XP_011392299.1 hypothetical protein UMAG_05977 [Ustilago maydis 521]
MAIDNFVYNAEHGVIICRQCETCLVPRKTSWVGHLRIRPHHMKGELLVRTIEHLSSFGHLSSINDLRQRAAARRRQRQPCRPLDSIALYKGYMCICAEACEYRTRRLDKVSITSGFHERKAAAL